MRILKYLFTILIACVIAFNSLSAGNNQTILIKNQEQNNPELFTYSNEKSTETDKTNNDSLYVPLSQFFYADNQRYTLSGSLPLKNTDLKLVPSIIFVSGLAVVFSAQHIGQLQTIWKETGDFGFREDIGDDLWADKAGHIYGSYLTSYLLSETLMEIGMSWEAASTWGGILGLSYSTYVEILDGYGVNWGFSPSDFYADIAGSAFFIGQYYIPYLQNFTPKFIYIPANWHGENPRQPNAMFIDDYSSQTFWLSINVHNMLPHEAKDYWPSWLQLSVGYAARNLCDIHKFDCDPKKADVRLTDVWGSPRYIIALDYDLAKILPDGGSFWNWLRQSLNHIKLPSPAIEFSASKTRYYLVYPFQL